jgi:isopentenyl-diphosphate delta-isomerase
VENNSNNINDPNAHTRKQDHIDLTFKSKLNSIEFDDRFYYEPLLAGHPTNNQKLDFDYFDNTMKYPMWISSMTGGTAIAKQININLAKACAEYGLGMGLGSCRSLLYSNDRIEDFAVRKYAGNQPLYANLGIAQIEELYKEKKLDLIRSLVDKLEVDGLIIHINPLQEWLQPEGDRYQMSPLSLIEEILDMFVLNIIVKEVGQGMGPESLKALLKLPIKAIEFGAKGGTNFSKLELLRSNKDKINTFESLYKLGHTAEEMVSFTNNIIQNESNIKCNQLIISGGISDFLDGYYLINKSNINAIYAQASAYLKPAMKSYEDLQEHIVNQIKGYELASQFLKVKV